MTFINNWFIFYKRNFVNGLGSDIFHFKYVGNHYLLHPIHSINIILKRLYNNDLL